MEDHSLCALVASDQFATDVCRSDYRVYVLSFQNFDLVLSHIVQPSHRIQQFS